ncbi:MAG: hypothetical protein IKV82_04115 [Akkermansia sp.]|nr:hypothetical protein [Akkermansia sp.]
MATTLSPEQLDLVRQWAAQGVDLNGIQKNLVAECDVHMTYMDVRFLLLDHGIEVAKPETVAPAPKEEPTPAPAPAPEEPAAMPAPAGGKPVVTLDELQIPGTLLSGKTEFPSGVKGSWQIDQMGRFGWSELSGTPSPAELQAFQFELTQMLSRGGAI